RSLRWRLLNGCGSEGWTARGRWPSARADPRSRRSGGQDPPIRADEDGMFGRALNGPATFVNQHMVVAAEETEVADVGRPVVEGPVFEVMGITPVPGPPAVGEAAVAVPYS